MPAPLLVLQDWLGVIYLVGLGLSLATIPLVILQSKSIHAKAMWVLALVAWTWPALFLYWVLGRNRLKRRVARLRRGRVAAMGGVDRRMLQSVRRQIEQAGTLTKELVLETQRMGIFPPQPGNEVELLTEGRTTFARAQEAVDAAHHHVHVATYIFRPDRTGREVLDTLIHAAKRGVQVRLIYDAVGSAFTGRKFFEPLVRAGGRVVSFLPFLSIQQMLRVNMRNHRKITVVDGQIAFMGGRNIGDEYARDPGWRDTHCRIRGPAVCGIQRVFLEDWYFATDELLDDEDYFCHARISGDVPVQVLATGPDQEVPRAEAVFFSAIAGATERVDIVTPYFVPPTALLAAIQSALMRGRRVRVLMGRRIDHYLVRWASEAVLAPLLEDGLELWYHPGMVHSKVIAVDGQWGTTGSLNLDSRSLRLNFELNVNFPHAPTAERLHEYVDTEIASSRRVNAEDLRYALPGRLLRNSAALFSPLI